MTWPRGAGLADLHAGAAEQQVGLQLLHGRPGLARAPKGDVVVAGTAEFGADGKLSVLGLLEGKTRQRPFDLEADIAELTFRHCLLDVAAYRFRKSQGQVAVHPGCMGSAELTLQIELAGPIALAAPTALELALCVVGQQLSLLHIDEAGACAVLEFDLRSEIVQRYPCLMKNTGKLQPPAFHADPGLAAVLAPFVGPLNIHVGTLQAGAAQPCGRRRGQCQLAYMGTQLRLIWSLD
jgi:hypothetical protein